MPSLTITLDEGEMQRLKDAAAGLGLAVEELVRLKINESLAREQLIDQEIDYILQKNAELYRRLAQ